MQINAEFPAKLKCLFQPSRYKVLYGGRGGAKSWGVARALLIKGAERPLRVLCAREIQRTIMDSVHRLLSDQIAALSLDSFYTVKDTEIEGKNGTTFAFSGLRAQGVGQLKSFEGVDICWVEEAQTVTKKSWDVLIPTIRKEGSEIWVTFNPELDTDETYTRFVVNTPPDTILANVNWRDNPWFPETLRQEKDHLAKVDPAAHENVWDGKCLSVVPGAIYRKEIIELIEQQRTRNVPYDPLLKVHTIWDLGWNDQMSIILAQRLGSEVRILEYIEDSHRTLADYVMDLNKRKYAWGTDWLPHDGAAKDFKTGKSTQEILLSMGRDAQVIPQRKVEEGIKAARLMFPRCYFDKDKTRRLVDCLKRYRRAINQSTNEPGAPLHDEYSHGADAFRYLATIVDKLTNYEADEDAYEEQDNTGRSTVGGY